MTFFEMTYRQFLGVAASLVLAGCAGTSQQDAGGSASVLVAQKCLEVRKIIDTAQYDNFSFRFAQANERIGEALTYYDDPGFDPVADCPAASNPSRGFLLATQGVSLSNQEQFLLASRRFDQAETALGANASIDERILLQNFRVQDALNRVQQSSRAGAVSDAGEEVTKFRTMLEDPSAQRLLRPGATSGSVDIVGLDRETIRQIIGTASGDHAQSVLAMDIGEYGQAEEFIQRAINEITVTPGIGTGYLPRFLIQKAIVQLQRARTTPGDPSKYIAARDTAALAVERIERVFANTPLAARAHMVSAKTETEVGNIDAALAAYDNAFAIYGENPTTVNFGSIWPFFRLADDVAQSNPARREEMVRRMFDAAQIVRSPTVAKTIAASSAALRVQSGDPAIVSAIDELVAAEEAFRLLTVRQILAENDQFRLGDSAALAREVEGARVRLASARAGLGLDTGNPVPGAEDYFEALGAPVSLSDVQGVLAPGEALVQILAGKPRGIVFVVTSDGLDYAFTERFSGQIALGGGDSVEKTSENYAKLILSDFRRIIEDGELYPFNVVTAHSAYKDILGPAAPLLAGHDSLIFAISGPLAAVPLELLVVEPPSAEAFDALLDRDDYSGIAWLGDRANVSYVPAPRSLYDLRQNRAAARSTAESPLLIFSGYEGVAPSSVETEIASVLASNQLTGGITGCEEPARLLIEGLGPVDPDVSNALILARTLGTDETAVIARDAFTQPRIESLGATLERAAILHFNTHGVLWDNADCFEEPALLVNRGNVAGEAGDRLLKSSEIQGLDLNALLVVLAACDTAGGDGLGGESLSGLARAFFLAGAQSVVASHWQVEETATTRLMQAMYEALEARPGVSFQDALYTARQTMRNSSDNSHPFYWAPFVLIGDGAVSLDAI